MQKICGGYVLKNTQKATGWACRAWQEWVHERNKSAEEQCSLALLKNRALTL